MQSRTARPSLAFVLACLLGAIVFAFDIRLAGIHMWARYLLPVAVVYFWGLRGELYLVTAFITVLMVASCGVEAQAGTVTLVDLLANHLLPLLVLWALAWLTVQHQNAEEEQAHRQEELTAQVQARTAELAAGERRYRLLAENATNVVWAVDMDGAMTYISRSVLSLRGFTREELLVMSWEERLQTGFPPELLATVQSGLADLRAGRAVAPGPYVIANRHKDGHAVWIESELAAIYDEAGCPAGLRGTTRNVTDREQALAALRRSEERFSKLFHSSPAGMSLTRRDGTYLDANDTYLAITGYTRDELIGHTSTELGIMRPATRGAQVALIDAQHEVFGHDIQIGSKGGETLDVYYSAETIDVDGEPCYLVSLVDITERKLIENELRKSAARFAKIFHASPAGIAVTRRRDAAFVETNQAFLDMVGYTRAEVIGRTAADLGFLTAEMRDEVLAAVHATDSVRGLHVPIVAARGAIVDVLAAVEQIDFGGEPCYLLLTMDITERLQAEARIHEALARLKLATEAAGIGIWNWNFADDSLDWDERMCELYGVSPSARQEGIYYDVWRASLHPDDRDFAESTLMAAVKEGSPWQIRFRLVLPDGTLRHIRTSSVVDCDRKGAPRRMIGINRDITDQVRYEQLLKETNAELEQHVAQSAPPTWRPPSPTCGAPPRSRTSSWPWSATSCAPPLWASSAWPSCWRTRLPARSTNARQSTWGASGRAATACWP